MKVRTLLKDKIKFKILHGTWTVNVVEAELFTAMNKGDDDVNAFALLEDHEIFLSKGDLKIEHLIHELTHAYFHMMCLSSSTMMTKECFEEIMCEFMSTHAPLLFKQADSLWEKIMKSSSKP